jgi:hypothetical protein
MYSYDVLNGFVLLRSFYFLLESIARRWWCVSAIVNVVGNETETTCLRQDCHRLCPRRTVNRKRFDPMKRVVSRVFREAEESLTQCWMFADAKRCGVLWRSGKSAVGSSAKVFHISLN